MAKRALTALVVAASVACPSGAQAHLTNGCKKNKCKRHVVAPFNAHLNRMAHCESTGRWFLNGFFDGGLQFSPTTWNATGSRYSFAYLAPVLEQKYRAVLWAKRIGFAWRSTAGWPNCG